MKRFLTLAVGVVVVVVFFLAGRALNSQPPAPQAPPRSAGEPRVEVRTAPTPQVQQAQSAGPAELPTLAVIPEADAEGTLSLQGLVLDAQELPVEGATVRLDSSAVAPVRTGKDGTFLFTKLPARAFQLEAFHDTAMAGPVTLWLNERTEPIVLHLLPAASLRVQVVAQGSRQAVAGAKVELRVPQPRTADSDASGHASLVALPPGRHPLKVAAPGFAPEWRLVDVGAASTVPQQLTVELKAGAAVTGTVVDSGGAPVAGARVTPVPQGGSLLALTDARWDGVTADAQGTWRIDNLGPGLYRFNASGSRHAPGMSAPVRLDGQQRVDGVVVTVGDAARLSGRVVDGRGQPVAGALVRVVLDEGVRNTLARQVTSDARGAFTVEALPLRRVAVAAVHEAASSSTRYVDLTQDAAAQPVELVLDATGVVRGRVEFSDGQVAGEAVILAEPVAQVARGRVEGTLRGKLSTVADAGGRFELKGLVAGAYRVRAAPAGTPVQRRTAWLVPPVTAETDGAEVVLKLRRGGSISGQVRREDGSVPEVFTVTLRGAPGELFGGDGRFQLRDVPEGEYTLYVSGAGALTKQVPGVKVQEGQDTQVGVLSLQRGRKVSGRVVGANGAPVADASVTVSQPLRGAGVVVGSMAELEHGLKQVRTDAEGRFSLDGLAITALQLAAEHPQEGRSSFLRVEEGVADQTLELRLSAVGRLEGTVRRAGEPISGALVIVTNPGAPAGGASGSSGTDGTFQFDSLAPGTYTVVAVLDSGAGQQVQRGTATITANATARLDLELPKGDVTLLVRAQPTADQQRPSVPAARAMLLAQGQQGGASGPTQVQLVTLQEPARFDGLSPGAYRVCLAPVKEGALAPDAGTAPSAASCQSVRVSPLPQEQVLTVAMPAT